MNDQSAAAVFQHADELRKRKLFAEVREALWKQEPKLARVAAALSSERIFFVPMFVSEGYFSEEIIPKALGFGHESRVQTRGGRTWFYCHPVGTHPRMNELLLSSASRVVKQHPFPRPPDPAEVTLFIAGHGTVQNANSRKAIEYQADLIRALNLYAAVEPVFLEEEPTIASCYELARTKKMIVAPFFIGDGMHVREDIPILLGEPKRIVQKRLQEGKSSWRNPTERRGKLVWYAESVGADPNLADIILARVREAAGGA